MGVEKQAFWILCDKDALGKKKEKEKKRRKEGKEKDRETERNELWDLYNIEHVNSPTPAHKEIEILFEALSINCFK